jgi:hypothetical protein
MAEIWDGIKAAFRAYPYLWAVLAAIPLLVWLLSGAAC